MKKMRKGITLIEIIISLALLGMIIIGVFPLFSTTMKINQTNREKQQIHEELITEMENYRSKTYKEIIIGNQLEKTIDKEKYEIRTKIEFEQDPQIIGNQSYGYLQLSIYAQNKETNEIIDEVKTYISNNGDDTTILVRSRDEWKEESGEIDWIENIQTELNNEYNGSKDTKTTDILGKTIYFNPPIGNYNVNIIATDYKKSPLSPNLENTSFLAKKGCTTYQEYWMYKPINIDVHHIVGTDSMDIKLKTSQNETLIDETFEGNYMETAYSVRPLGDGNQSHYTIEAGFGTNSGSGSVWIEDEYLYDKWNSNPGQYKRWVDNYIKYKKHNGASNYWKLANSVTVIDGLRHTTSGQLRWEDIGGWKRVYGIWYIEEYSDGTYSPWTWIKGEWVPNPDTSSSYDHVYRYLIKPGHEETQEGIYTPDYSANLYYKNAENKWTQLDPKQLKLQKTVEGKFIFENGTINTVSNKSELKLIVKATTDTTAINETTDNKIILTISQ